MQAIQEKKIGSVNGFVGLLLLLAILAFAVWALVQTTPEVEVSGPNALFWTGLAAAVIGFLLFGGLFVVQPNEAKVFTLFGTYAGSVRDPGFYFTNPFTKRVKVSLRIRNFSSQTLKVNDAGGNPIEIAAVVVWRVIDSAKALYSVESYENFVNTQSETAIRTLASRFNYDQHEAGEGRFSLRGSPDEVAHELQVQLEERLKEAGVAVVEARLSHLAYAPEIAQAMLKRQQAEAVIAARRLIVDGAVGMVQMALQSLEEQGVVKLDNERRAAMVNNLLVALVSDSDAQPVINTGTLYA